MPFADIRLTHLSRLEKRAAAVERIARWYVDEWGGPDADPDTATALVAARLGSATSGDGLPSTWTAEVDRRLAGAAQLKRREVPALDAFEYWLGGVYVDTAFRGSGVARRLVERCVEEARLRDIERLYLQTEACNVGLYGRLGWRPATLPDGIVHERPVMVRALRVTS